MQKIKIITIVLFFTLLLTPVVLFNWEEGVVSPIDNRTLAENPLKVRKNSEEYYDLTEGIESYLEDRIGLRDEMILAYTQINDKLFKKMVHPTYTYGKNGYVFFNMPRKQEYSDFHSTFADMVKKIQSYCEERDVPFLFVFNPAKISVLREHLPTGVNYNNEWVTEFMEDLDERDINYVNNTTILLNKTYEGINVFNPKYDAGHWNDLGAFYGVNNAIEALKGEFSSGLHINSISDFSVTEEMATTLPVSEFPIQEKTPKFEIKAIIENKTDDFSSGIKLHPSYRGFGYFVNEERLAEGAPKTLVFQGSYMNGKGGKFLQNSLGEYIYIHDYQNVINFPYYFNVFKPECVIFEVAEYTFSNGYFSYEGMKNIDFNPVLDNCNNRQTVSKVLLPEMLSVNERKGLVEIKISGLPDNISYAWLVLDGEEFDLLKDSSAPGKFYLDIEQKKWKNDDSNISVVILNSDKKIVYNRTGKTEK